MKQFLILGLAASVLGLAACSGQPRTDSKILEDQKKAAELAKRPPAEQIEVIRNDPNIPPEMKERRIQQLQSQMGR